MAAEQHVEDPENPEKSLKRKREPSVLDNFTKLTNGQEKIRIKSGVDLLRHLTDNEHTEKGGDELKYALGRLIRGLGSSKTHAKTGFFAALVGLLNLKNISIEEIFEHVAKELHSSGSNSKSENADICSGQILTAGAILRSNLYEKCVDSDKSKVLELLLNAGKERTYLNLASFKFLIDLFAKIDSQEFERLIFPLIKSELGKPWQEQDLDSLYLLVEVLNYFPDSVKIKFLKNNLGTSEVLCVESLPDVCNTLTTIPRVVALKHPIFDLFVKKISESDLIVEFFSQLDLTLSRPNRNKYFVVTKLLTGVLNNLQDITIIPNILTKNYIIQTLSTYRTAVGKLKDKEFQDSSHKLFDALLANLKKEEAKHKTKIKVLKRLLFYPGTFIFEKVTKTKLIQSITATLNAEGVKKLGGIYREVVLAVKERVVNENMSERWWNMDRVYASHLLVKLVNHPSMHEENEWKIEQLEFLMKLGLLRDQSDNIGHELADSLKETFYSSLDLKLGKLEDLRVILSRVLHSLDEILTEDNLEVALRHPLTKDDYETWKRTVELATKKESTTKKKYAVFHTLFLHLGLQLFNNAKLASESLKELFSCYERVKKSKKTQIESSSDDPLWIEVVVDLFLNLLSHSSHLMRSVINCVFPHLCKYMNATAIHQILSVLDPKNESNPLSKAEESDDDDKSESSEEEEESSESDDADEEENVNDKLRLALQQVLGANPSSDAESVDLDDLNDDEGDQLDEALGKAFTQFKPNLGRQKKQNKDDQTLTHFRIRVLDLIEIYLNSNPSMLLSLEIMLPLLQTLEFSIRDDHQKPLQDRVRSCLKKLSSLKKFGDCEDVSEEILVGLLKSLLDKGTKNAIIIQDMGEKIAECCIFIINCSQVIRSRQSETPKKKKTINRALEGGLEAFFTKRDCLIPYVLFKSLLQLNWEGIVGLVPLLTGFAFTHTVRPFRRSQALELLKLFYSNHRFLNLHEDIITVEDHTNNLVMDSIGFFNDFCANPKERTVKEKFVCNLFELLNCVKSSKVGASFNGWESVGDAARACRAQLTLSRDTKLAFNKLCKSLKISNVVPMNREVVKLNGVEDDDGEGAEKPQKAKKKRRFNKESLKLRKESKELRLQSLSEGFGKRKSVWEEADGDKRMKADEFVV